MTITVSELIAQLSELPGDSIVILQKDSEGNGYSPCVGADTAMYVPESTWSGEVLNQEDYEEDQESYEDAIPCVVLWPVN